MSTRPSARRARTPASASASLAIVSSDPGRPVDSAVAWKTRMRRSARSEPSSSARLPHHLDAADGAHRTNRHRRPCSRTPDHQNDVDDPSRHRRNVAAVHFSNIRRFFGGQFSMSPGGQFRMSLDIAQRRPGRTPRRHSGAAGDPLAIQVRSTKAGAHTPATQDIEPLPDAPAGIAQRRPGRTPRRHTNGCNACAGATFAQRRPGRTPRRHPHAGHRRATHPLRSTKAGAHTPATLSAEGRSSPASSAQRRPGRTPRRHDCRPLQTDSSRHRSTKAGAHTPATRRPRNCNTPAPSTAQRRPGRTPRRHPPSFCSARNIWIAQRRPGRTPRRHPPPNPAKVTDSRAQRRPGRTPRRHLPGSLFTVRGQHRSTKAGAHTPATPDRPTVRVPQQPRSTKAGAHTPATPPTSPTPAADSTTLNEGRGAHPGDTCLDDGRQADSLLRSTKAGAHTPATPGGCRADTATGPRSTKAGAHTPATQPNDAARLDHHHRSTKAGAHTPATLEGCPDVVARRSALNEGRGAHPGDTDASRMNVSSCAAAQRRPGRTPRRHLPAAAVIILFALAQRRPGRTPRRHAVRPLHHHVAPVRSTKAGAHTPATRIRHRRRPPRTGPLNEGRGAHPGDTLPMPSQLSSLPHRSTKAGAHTPATRLRHLQIPDMSKNAQRRPGRTPRRHVNASGS